MRRLNMSPLSTIKNGEITYILLLSSIISFVAAGSTLQVNVPASLHKQGGYEHIDTSFGVLPYGGSIQLPVYYTNLTMCEPVATANLTGYPLPTMNEYGEPEPWQSPFILMVDPTGDCTYETKIRFSQEAGAAGVLLTSLHCRCQDPNCTPDSPDDKCEAPISFIGEENPASDITIPAFLVFKQGADPIKQTLMANRLVQAEMSYAVPDPESKVDYALWTTPRDEHSRDFLLSFVDADFALGTSANFTPHMLIQDGHQLGCVGSNSACSPTMCTNQGRYCASPSGNVTGADIVIESLRRLCIWKLYGGDGIGASWWLYIYLFLQNCELSDVNFADLDCVNSSYGPLIDADLVQGCIDKSGGVTADQSNEILELEVKALQNRRITVLPTLMVEGKTVAGPLSFGNVFQAICGAFASGYEPSICLHCAYCRDVQACVKGYGQCEAYVASHHGGGKSSEIWTVTSAMGLAFLVAGLAWAYHQRQRRLMPQRVREIVSLYAPLDFHHEGTQGIEAVSVNRDPLFATPNSNTVWGSSDPNFSIS